MSWGTVICEVCKRQVHQDGPKDSNGRTTWTHCEDKTARCPGATSIFPASVDEIRGKYCGCDGGLVPR